MLPLFIGPGAGAACLEEGCRESGGSGHVDCSFGNIGKRGRGIHDHHVFVQIYDLWVCAFLYGVFFAAFKPAEKMIKERRYAL